MTPEALHEVLLEGLPASGPLFSLEYAPEAMSYGYDGRPAGPQPGTYATPSGDLRVVLRTLVFTPASPSQPRTIRDVKEQDCRFLAAEHSDHPRVDAYIQGWLQAVRFLVVEGDMIALSLTMPGDLVCCDVLKLKRPKTADDFQEVMLQARRRLGRFLV